MSWCSGRPLNHWIIGLLGYLSWRSSIKGLQNDFGVSGRAYEYSFGVSSVPAFSALMTFGFFAAPIASGQLLALFHSSGQLRLEVVLWGLGLLRLRGLCLRGDPFRFVDLPRVGLSLLRLGVRVLLRDFDLSFSGFVSRGAGMAAWDSVDSAGDL